MRLAGVSIVRDEADIIEAWVRHNLFFLDQLYIVDDGSTDQTARILDILVREGLPISVTSEKSLAAYHQGQRTTALVEHALKTFSWDFIFPLDGDEFVVAEDRSVLEADLAALGGYRVGGLNPRHYVMTHHDDPDEPCPLTRLRHVAVHDPYVFKVVVPGRLAAERGFGIVDGNHGATKWDVPLPSTLLPNVQLAHFPARSEAQLVSKGIAGYLRWTARRDFSQGAPIRLLEGVGILKEEDDIKVRALDRLAEALGADRGSHTARLQPFVERKGEVRYPELARIFPYRRVLSATDDLVHAFKAALDENRELRQGGATFQSRLIAAFSRHRKSLRRRLTALRHAQGAPKEPVGYS
ncbi:glycosyltransferase family 2 protein [Xanthobacter sp. 126]|uniref:glycosyltransferase family 2 protein n=1 Tax=Xanthobacter sp. 126 TaxID=1131814 RepID=UPI00045E82CB|nr:glycosyltransferase family 2 protein [Xanthobacter sp. 126]